MLAVGMEIERRLLAVFGSVKCQVPSIFWTVCRMWIVPAFRSTSSHRRASASPSQVKRNRDGEEGLESITPHDREEGAGLVRRQGVNFRPAGPWGIDKRRDVAGDEPPLHGLVEGAAEHRAHVLHRSWG